MSAVSRYVPSVCRLIQFCVFLLWSLGVGAQAIVDASTLNKKIMAGYQGWFGTQQDGSGAGWRHWAPAGSLPTASSVRVDMWPDLREFSPSELTATDFRYENGSIAGLYSAFNKTSVERHFKWMKDYAIDGVFVQRFVTEAVALRSVRDQVLLNAQSGAELHGRIFANMYDVTGANSSRLTGDITSDWIHLVDNLGVTSSTRYARHRGRPVVAIWGFGLPNNPGSAAELSALISWFKSGAPEKYRATIMLGVDPNWRSHSTEWQNAYRGADILSPWTVGRYRDDAGIDQWRDEKIEPDLRALDRSSTEYMPVVYPGFSWCNLKRDPSRCNEIPRRGGRFFWRQAYNAILSGTTMLYVAMFDEVDEGTAMYKLAENKSQLPTTGRFVSLDADGENIPSDHYLRLMGEAGRMLRGERPLDLTMLPTTAEQATLPIFDALASGQSLLTGERLTSSNKIYWMVLQHDGNLVVYTKDSRVLWSSNTVAKGGVRLTLQRDGNLVLRNSSGGAVWSTKTNGQEAVRLVMQDDGNLVLQNAAGALVWRTNTAQSVGGTGGRVRVAFVGDSGAGGNFQNVLNLIKSERADMTMFLGDTSYSASGDDTWNSRIVNTLPSTDPVLVAVGNHDVEDSKLEKIVSLSQARLKKQSAVKCSGTYGQRMTCNFKNLYFVISGVGTLGSISDHERFIESSLDAAPANAWRICVWHKNQRQMQVGGKSDETGWNVYEICRRQGAFIATGHEHSYSRTHLLRDMSERTVDSTSSKFTVSPGKTFAFVSGLGGIGIRDQEIAGSWWASVYTSNQRANYGVLFGDFYADRAEFYFKNIDGKVIDRFTVLKGY